METRSIVGGQLFPGSRFGEDVVDSIKSSLGHLGGSAMTAKTGEPSSHTANADGPDRGDD